MIARSYDKKEISPTTTIFELSFMIEGHTIKMSAQIDVKRRACILVGYLPIYADPVYSYPLCQLIAKENAKKLFGAIKYDERDGEVTYDYAYSVANGIDEYVLHREFKPVMDPGGNWIRMPTSQTIDDDFQLKRYNNEDSFYWSTILFEPYGYGAIEDPQTLRYFTMALHREALKLYRGAAPSPIRKNAYGFYGFEFKVEEKKQKSIL